MGVLVDGMITGLNWGALNYVLPITNELQEGFEEINRLMHEDSWNAPLL